jgi:predicted component of type VI protein secretion system
MSFGDLLPDGTGGAMKAELVPENGDPPIPIVRDVTVVGRREYCDVVIHNHSLSKRHCVLVKTDGLLVIRDLATTNGTKVKGQKVRWAALLPDDRVSLGAYKMRIYLGPDDMPSPSEQARARGRAGGRAAGAGDAGGPAAPSISPWPGQGSPVQPAVAVGFPEPSLNQVSTFPPPSMARPVSKAPGPNTSPIEDDFQFEILEDDDDDIIDLD